MFTLKWLCNQFFVTDDRHYFMFDGQLQQIAFIWCFALYFRSFAQQSYKVSQNGHSLVSLLGSEHFVIIKKIDSLGKFSPEAAWYIFDWLFYLVTVGLWRSNVTYWLQIISWPVVCFSIPSNGCNQIIF